MSTLLVQGFSILLKLMPFVLAIVTYFTNFIPQKGDVVYIYVKCLPIICLIIFVGLHSKDVIDSNYQWYSHAVMLGLVFCGLGDALLGVVFEIGMLAFAIGHICYTLAFGFEPIAWILGCAFYALAIAFSIYFVPDLSGIEYGAVPIYSIIIVTMVWRAWARLTDKRNWTISKLVTALGALVFAVSDSTLALSRYKMDFKHSEICDWQLKIIYILERFNGLLKMRLRCLLKHRVFHYAPEVASKIINACAVLHNMCIEHNIVETKIEYDIDYGLIHYRQVPTMDHGKNNSDLATTRRLKKQLIQNYFNLSSKRRLHLAYI